MTAPNTLGCEDAGQLILTVSLLFAHFCRCSGLFFRIEAFLSGAFGGVFGASLFSSLNTPVTGHWQTGIKIYLWCVLVMSACPCFVLFSVFYYSVWGFFFIQALVGFFLIVLISTTCVWFSHLCLIVSVPPPNLLVYKMHFPASMCQSMTWWCVCSECVCWVISFSVFCFPLTFNLGPCLHPDYHPVLCFQLETPLSFPSQQNSVCKSPH